MFSVQTEVQKLTELDEKQKKELVREIRNWGSSEATIKGRVLWETAVMGFCRERAEPRDDRDSC